MDSAQEGRHWAGRPGIEVWVLVEPEVPTELGVFFEYFL